MEELCLTRFIGIDSLPILPPIPDTEFGRGPLAVARLAFVTGWVGRAKFDVDPVLPVNIYGRFVGAADPAWLDDGRTMRLKHDFTYVDPYQKAWVAPARSVIDGASISRAFWTLVGGPYEGKYRNASIVHDVACVNRTEPSDDVHRMFYFACRCGGVDEVHAKYLYIAVHNWGPHGK